MAIQNRRGVYKNFDPSKLLPGEWAIVLSGDPDARDGKAAYICFAAGDVKQIATVEDMNEIISSQVKDAKSLISAEVVEQVTGDISVVVTNASNAISACEDATQSANEAAAEAERAIGSVDTVVTRATRAAEAAEEAAEKANAAAGGSTVEIETIDTSTAVSAIQKAVARLDKTAHVEVETVGVDVAAAAIAAMFEDGE